MVVHEPHRFGRPAHGVRGTGLSPRTAAVCDMPPWTKVCERGADRSNWRRAHLKISVPWRRGHDGQEHRGHLRGGQSCVSSPSTPSSKRALRGRHLVTLSQHGHAAGPGTARGAPGSTITPGAGSGCRAHRDSRSRGGHGALAAVGEGLSPVVRHSPDPVEHLRGGALAGLDGAVEASDRSGTWLGEAVADLGPCGREVGSRHEGGFDAGFVHVRPDGGHGPDVDVGADEGVEAVGGVPG